MTSQALSVYIPVYNAERYLTRCLDSVLNQTFSDFELYIYNDGSTDNSYEICREYARKDPRILLTTGENGHSVDVLNTFLGNANGKYIAFVDNDDYLDLDYFEKMIQMLEDKGADCVISSFTYVDSEENELPWYTPQLEDGLLLSREDVLKRFLTSLDIEGFRWNKIFLKSVLTDNNFHFSKLIPGDINSEFELLSHINKAVLLNHRGYYYRQSATSYVGTMSPQKTVYFLDTFGRIGDLAVAQGLTEEGEYYRIWRRINSMFITWKKKNEYAPSDLDRFRKKCSWDRMVGCSLRKAISKVQKYKNKKESSLKFAVKTFIVWRYYS